MIVDVIGVVGTSRFALLLFDVYGDGGFDRSGVPLMVLLVGGVGGDDRNGYG